MIASTGRDSFMMSSLEIAACGLLLLVSGLQGLSETVDEGKTGFKFRPGDFKELCENINALLDNEMLREIMGKNQGKELF